VLDLATVSVPAPRQALAARAVTMQDFDVPFELTHPVDALQIAGLTSTNFRVLAVTTGPHGGVAAQ
jgi:hypothetical protein